MRGNALMENSNIAWTHHTQNFWLGCDKIAPECAHCYIARTLRQQRREPWGHLYRTKTWDIPLRWQRQAEAKNICYRVFTNSLSDFFHAEADAWREDAWEIIKRTQNLIYLILTKRPELIEKRLPADWGEGWPNVWLGVSSGCRMTLNKMDSLRRIRIHPKAVRFLSAEPLLEDISAQIKLDGFDWIIVGGESGGGPEYFWDEGMDWRKEFNLPGRRIMRVEWAQNLLAKARAAGIPYFFKQITAFRSGSGEDALGQRYQEFPPAPVGSWPEQLGSVHPNTGRRAAHCPISRKRNVPPTQTADIRLSDREKQAILQLAGAGVNNDVIASAFGIRPMAVAAYKAWATMRARK
jgi:protein gp37